jgi:hypothetical protein
VLFGRQLGQVAVLGLRHTGGEMARP